MFGRREEEQDAASSSSTCYCWETFWRQSLSSAPMLLTDFFESGTTNNGMEHGSISLLRVPRDRRREAPQRRYNNTVPRSLALIFFADASREFR